MNRYQKIAWLNLIVIAATIIVTATAIAVEFHMRGRPHRSVAVFRYRLPRVGPEGMVSVNVMPLVLVGAVAIFLLVEYLAAFIQYGRGGDDHE
jgi:hypothetical protein